MKQMAQMMSRMKLNRCLIVLFLCKDKVCFGYDQKEITDSATEKGNSINPMGFDTIFSITSPSHLFDLLFVCCQQCALKVYKNRGISMISGIPEGSDRIKYLHIQHLDYLSEIIQRVFPEIKLKI